MLTKFSETNYLICHSWKFEIYGVVCKYFSHLPFSSLSLVPSPLGALEVPTKKYAPGPSPSYEKWRMCRVLESTAYT
jgi:hypothetical protein